MPTAEETATKLQEARNALAEAEAAHAAAVEDAPPRAPMTIICDYLDAVTMRFGHHPKFAKLSAELHKALAAEE